MSQTVYMRKNWPGQPSKTVYTRKSWLSQPGHPAIERGSPGQPSQLSDSHINSPPHFVTESKTAWFTQGSSGGRRDNFSPYKQALRLTKGTMCVPLERAVCTIYNPQCVCEQTSLTRAMVCDLLTQTNIVRVIFDCELSGWSRRLVGQDFIYQFIKQDMSTVFFK